MKKTSAFIGTAGTLIPLLVCAIAVLSFSSCAASSNNARKADTAAVNNEAIGNMIHSYAARNFAAGEVTEEEIKTILECGAWAPSARNGQPWHFTVVRDRGLGKKIISNLTENNIIIIVSASKEQKPGMNADLDCGLAVQNIYLAAQALGLGSRIYTGPVDSVNKNYRNELGFPEGFEAVALIRIGRLQDSADALSAASGRKELGAIVNYK
ncbi:nitroreductase family protein [Treponema sp. OttesenSCG-928-L16]|nr:nitroreductase family protein [Treponema sp. OttesenSCG-928-L16]